MHLTSSDGFVLTHEQIVGVIEAQRGVHNVVYRAHGRTYTQTVLDTFVVGQVGEYRYPAEPSGIDADVILRGAEEQGWEVRR